MADRRTFRFHVAALPHVPTSKRSCSCAFTMKVYNFCRMMMELGHEVYLYGPDGNEAPCTQHVRVISAREQRLLYGRRGPTEHFGLNYDANSPLWRLVNGRTLKHIKKNKRPRDFVCLIAGNAQRPIADGVGVDVHVVEYGVGYEGVFARHKVFESYTHMASIVGMLRQHNSVHNYDAVIPNYYEVADFPTQPTQGDYAVFIGRVSACKGVNIAVDATRAAGMRLIIAGQGVDSYEGGNIKTSEFTIHSDLVTYAGVVDVKERAELVGRAKLLIAPSRYLEPFGGVVAEAQLMGTPVVTSDWGAFAETVEHGRTGFRCRTLQQFADGCRLAPTLDRDYIRRRAVGMWDSDRVRLMYQEYFTMLDNLWDERGWSKMDGPSDPHWLSTRQTREGT